MSNQSTVVTTQPSLQEKIDKLFTLDRITLAHLDGMDDRQRAQLSGIINEKLLHLKGDERDAFLEKVNAVITVTSKNQLWEHNQQTISSTITAYMRQHGVMPSKSLIAQQTGLSRQTVIKHFKEYKTHPEHVAEMEQFKFMAPRVLSSVFKFALNGDVRAARLYFEMVGAANKLQTNTVVNEQNNYIQINNTILSQENLKQLTAAQLNEIEKIIRKEEIGLAE